MHVWKGYNGYDDDDDDDELALSKTKYLFNWVIKYIISNRMNLSS